MNTAQSYGTRLSLVHKTCSNTACHGELTHRFQNGDRTHARLWSAAWYVFQRRSWNVDEYHSYGFAVSCLWMAPNSSEWRPRSALSTFWYVPTNRITGGITANCGFRCLACHSSSCRLHDIMGVGFHQNNRVYALAHDNWPVFYRSGIQSLLHQELFNGTAFHE